MELTPREAEVIQMKRAHEGVWKDKSTFEWFMGLMEEVAELADALLKVHEGPVSHELAQIAAICINFSELLDARS